MQGPPVPIPHDDHFFHPLARVREAAAQDRRTREHPGSGTERLETPGLVRIEALKTRGGTVIPAREERRYPGDIATLEGTGWNWVVVPHEHFRHVRTDTENYLLRSALSDGTQTWPQVDSFFVTGEWEGEPEPAAEPNGKPKGK